MGDNDFSDSAVQGATVHSTAGELKSLVSSIFNTITEVSLVRSRASGPTAQTNTGIQTNKHRHPSQVRTRAMASKPKPTKPSAAAPSGRNEQTEPWHILQTEISGKYKSSLLVLFGYYASEEGTDPLVSSFGASLRPNMSSYVACAPARIRPRLLGPPTSRRTNRRDPNAGTAASPGAAAALGPTLTPMSSVPL